MNRLAVAALPPSVALIGDGSVVAIHTHYTPLPLLQPVSPCIINGSLPAGVQGPGVGSVHGQELHLEYLSRFCCYVQRCVPLLLVEDDDRKIEHSCQNLSITLTDASKQEGTLTLVPFM